MTAILGVDLATRRYADIGLAVLRPVNAAIQVDLIALADWQGSGTPDAAQFSAFIAAVAEREKVSLLALDGPQAWKAADNGLIHARHCEQQLHTQTKTGLPGQTKPGTALRFAEFSIECFDRLAELGWSRLGTPADLQPNARLALEVFPTAAWRAMGLRPLPAKAKTTPVDVAWWLRDLQQRQPLILPRQPTHDELQAVVAGLVGVAVAQGDRDQFELHGAPLCQVEQTWREGYIVNLKMTR